MGLLDEIKENSNFPSCRGILDIERQWLISDKEHVLTVLSAIKLIFNFKHLQICRNINRIKVCMETGRTVILLNLESLYESLYDALNQVCCVVL